MNLYTALADHINKVYALRLKPHSQDSAFVKLFARLLSEDEVKTALLLDDRLKTASELAASPDEVSSLVLLLHSLAQKGIIYEQLEEKTDGPVCRYRLLPFIPGIFESLIKVSGEPEISGYLHQYAQEMEDLHPKSNVRKIRVDQRVEVVTYRASQQELCLLLDQSTRFAVMDCLCRTLRASSGQACGHPIKDMCIITGEYADYYVRIGNARAVNRSDVEAVLHRAREAGLFHEIYPIDGSRSSFICNCCGCGCMFLSLNSRIRHVIRQDSCISINSSQCTNCGACVDQCPQQIFEWDSLGNVLIVNDESCFRCGLCSLSCPTGALSMAD